jgi:hypothetical protein
MEDSLPAVTVAEPAGTYRDGAGSGAAVPEENGGEFCEALRKIGEDFGSDFALAALRTDKAGQCNACLFGGSHVWN